MFGILAALAGQFEPAEKLLTEAIKVDPKEADCHPNLANIYPDTGRVDLAVTTHETALIPRRAFPAGRQ